MIKYLEITLKSDICIGSGYSYAGIVDADSCFDRFGLPYIPARRIKGCLREAAELIGADRTIFGDWGQSSVGQETPISISDAFISGYRRIAEALEETAGQDKAAQFLSPDRIQACYSRVKAQTAIDENGVARENTLRFMRTVNHYGVQKEELRFYAEVYLRDGDVRSVEVLTKAARALRHMGENRTRGLGNVICRLLPDQEAQEKISRNEITDKILFSIKNEELPDTAGERAELSYTIKTEAPVVMSMEDDKNSETYINGRSVLGYFAGMYLKQTGKQADDSFEALFLKDRLLFSPLYPSSANGTVYRPAPTWLAKLKKSGELVNVGIKKIPEKDDPDFGEEALNGKYFSGNGNQPKKLKGKYVSFEETPPDIREVETEIIYHHRHESESAEEQLYALNAIRAGQYFSGTITGDAKDVKVMAGLLKAGSLRLGKSRSAQYGLCLVVSAEVKKAEGQENAVACKKGNKIFVTLQSDGLFIDGETGNYTVRTEKVREQIRESVEEFLKKNGQQAESGFLESADGTDGGLYSEIEVKQLSGHYGVWNLRRASVPCVCAGTTFEYEVGCDFNLPAGIILTGVCGGEGFGRLAIRKNEDKWLVGKKPETEAAEGPENKKTESEKQEGAKPKLRVPDVLADIYRESARTELFRLMESKALGVEKQSLSASAVGRITLMFTECVNENRDAPEKIRGELEKRIQSVKDKEKQKKAMEFLKAYYDNAFDGKKGQRQEMQEILSRISNEGSRKALETACRLHCLEQALTMLKYKTKEES